METKEYDGSGHREGSVPGSKLELISTRGRRLELRKGMVNVREIRRWDRQCSSKITEAGSYAMADCITGEVMEFSNATDVADSSKSRKGTRSPARTYSRPDFLARRTCLLLTLLFLVLTPVYAVLVPFDNCLSDSRKRDLPLTLQIVPHLVDATFDTKDPAHSLVIHSYINVNGSFTQSVPPSSDIDYWSGNATDRGGKIIDVPYPDGANKFTTATTTANVLTYEPLSMVQAFCEALKNGTCPLAPQFGVNQSDTTQLPYLRFQHNMYSTYAFTSLSVTTIAVYGDEQATPIGCISVEVTPDLGSTLTSVLTYIPLAVLILVGLATAFAAVLSPWGSTNTFRWTTNYGRDQDLLRLVTPGFGDCLQYIQFVALTGGLSLNYPGFYQPIVSKVAWSALMFNQSFVMDRVGYNSLIDGLYVTEGDYGLDRIRQLVGMGAEDDVWAGMIIWLMVILASVLAMIQLGFLFRWALRKLQKNPEEDLRAKNFPFSAGNVIRLVFNYFLLPIVTLTMFQLVAAGRSPIYTVVLAVVCVVLILGFAVLLFLKIVRTREKAQLFDDLPTLMLYGSLYNTYSDDAALFALVPFVLTFTRGIAIGAIQPSGIAQIVMLAICEVITILTLHAFRPFHSPTSMNAFHTFFSAIRFSTILLMIAFSPSLGVTSGPKGWIGYAILLMHAIVLLFGFLLNAIQTIVEVGARLAGAGGDGSTATRGGLIRVFGMRQLSRRLPRNSREASASRQSQLSNAAMLAGENERRSFMMSNDGRVRSQSAGSANLLLRSSTGMDSIDPHSGVGSQAPPGGSAYTPTTPGEASTFSFLPSQPAAGQARRGTILALNSQDTADPYYRPPRARRPTIENHSPGARSRGSWISTGWPNRRDSQHESNTPDKTENFEGPSISGRNTPVPLAGIDSPPDPGRSPADYTTREVDFYYGVRGPALNANIPSRRIKTGPADPTGPAASAAGWFKSLFGGKTKDSGKGFEVVRSSRMPPGMQARGHPEADTPPEGIPVATGVIRQSGPIDSDDESPVRQPATSQFASTTQVEDMEDIEIFDDERPTRLSDIPPMLPGIEVDDQGIELPSRFPSKATTRGGSTRKSNALDQSLIPGIPMEGPSRTPTVPRKSSRRKSQSVDISSRDLQLLHQPLPTQHRGQGSLDSTRLPFDRSNSARRTVSTRSTNPVDDYETRHDPSLAGGYIAGEERPTSMGFVHQHMARTVTPSNNPDYLGTSAEVVDGRHSNASSMEEGRSK